MNTEYLHPADQLVMFMQRIYDKGLTTTSGGNLSIIDNDGNVWITPGSVDKGSLNGKDIICVRPDGTTVGPHKPSSELPFHISVYKKRPDVKAVLHAHPPALLAFSIVRKIPNLDLIPSIRSVCKDAKIAAYGVPGSDDLGDKIAEVFEGCDIAILENHGVCIGAKDMSEAFQKLETLNYAAELEILVSRIGGREHQANESINGTTTGTLIEMSDYASNYHSSEELSARRDMVTLIHRSYRMGLFTATQGTYSVRLSDNSFLITPHGKDRAYLQEDDLVHIVNGKKEEGKTPSRAVQLHAEIYRNNPKISAVLQAHPVYSMAFAVTDCILDSRTIPESYILLRDIRKLSGGEVYNNPNTAAKVFSYKHPILMLKQDCVVVTGNNLLHAFERLEVLEVTARAIINSFDIGTIVHIADSEVEKLKKAFQLKD